jgi:flagellar protein FlgJ
MMVPYMGNVHGAGEQPGDAPNERHRQLRAACAEFEAVLLYEIVKGMRRTIAKCDLFHGGHGEEVYEQLLDRELCKSVSSASGLGLGETLYRQLRHGIGPEIQGSGAVARGRNEG